MQLPRYTTTRQNTSLCSATTTYRPSADDVALPAFARCTPAIDRYLLPAGAGPQQQSFLL